MNPSLRYMADFALLIIVIGAILVLTTLPTAKGSWVGRHNNIQLVE